MCLEALLSPVQDRLLDRGGERLAFGKEAHLVELALQGCSRVVHGLVGLGKFDKMVEELLRDRVGALLNLRENRGELFVQARRLDLRLVVEGPELDVVN